MSANACLQQKNGINGEEQKYQYDPSKSTESSRFGQTIWSADDFSRAITNETELDS